MKTKDELSRDFVKINRLVIPKLFAESIIFRSTLENPNWKDLIISGNETIEAAIEPATHVNAIVLPVKL